MFNNFYKKNEKIILFQLKNKLLYNNYYNSNKINYSYGIIDYLSAKKKLKSIIILKLLILLELIFNQKALIKNFFAKFSKLRLQMFVIIRKKKFYHFFFLMKYFYIPMLIRRNIFLKRKSYDKSGNYWFIMDDLNMLPFLFSSFFLLKPKLKIGLFLKKNNKNENKLLMESFNLIKR